MCMCVFVRVCVRERKRRSKRDVRVYLCVCERERERERERRKCEFVSFPLNVLKHSERNSPFFFLSFSLGKIEDEEESY